MVEQVHEQVTVHMWQSWEIGRSQFSFYHVSIGDRTQSFVFGTTMLYPENHLTSVQLDLCDCCLEQENPQGHVSRLSPEMLVFL